MRLTRELLACLAAAVLATGLRAGTSPEPVFAAPQRKEALPDAASVVVRRKQRVDEAFAVALEAAVLARGDRETKPFPVAFIVDPTPRLATWAPYLGKALGRLDKNIDQVATWHVASLGDKFGKPAKSVAEAAAQLSASASSDETIKNTTLALRESIKSLRRKGALVIYLADEHFEDDWELEKLVADVTKSKLVFCAIGPEGAYGRGWNDGMIRAWEKAPTGIGRDYWPDIGRDPFGRGSATAPWHGGDICAPLVPYDFSPFEWSTEFDVGDIGHRVPDTDKLSESLDELAELDDEERLKRMKELMGLGESKPVALPADEYGPAGDVSHVVTDREAPLPSGFGPYGLSRLAAVSGGRYITFGWNRIRVPSVSYDYGRLNLYGPDLRDREAIAEHIRENAVARAGLEAWAALAAWGDDFTHTTPPLTGKQVNVSETISVLPPNFDLHAGWSKLNERDEWLEKASEAESALRAVRERLQRVLEGKPEDSPSWQRRYELEAERALHILDARLLRLSAGIEIARAIPRSAWETKKTRVYLGNTLWIDRVRSGELTFRVEASVVPEGCREAAAEFEARHRRLLEAYQGTPWGAELSMNRVYLPEVKGYEAQPYRPLPKRGPPDPTPRPSGGDPAPPPTGGSTGGGSTTGGG